MLGISDEVLIQELHDLARRERKITNQILIRINEFERRKLHLELGYASVIEWLIKELHYSEGAAYRRLNAARVLRDVPTAAEKLEDGKITLSSLASLQSAVRAEERRTSERVSATLKQELIQNLEEKTRIETAQVLGETFPEIQLTPREGLRPVNQEESKLTVILDQETAQALTRAKELLSHAIPSGEWSEVIARPFSRVSRTQGSIAKESQRKSHRPGQRSDPTSGCPYGYLSYQRTTRSKLRGEVAERNTPGTSASIATTALSGRDAERSRSVSNT